MSGVSKIFVGAGERDNGLLTRYANRHGLVTGATGTGKTVTLRVLAEGFSAAGVPVFVADAKGMVERVLLGDGRRQGLAEAMAKSAVRTVGRQVGLSPVRGILGSLFKR